MLSEAQTMITTHLKLPWMAEIICLFKEIRMANGESINIFFILRLRTGINWSDI